MEWDLAVTARCLEEDLGLSGWLDPDGIRASDNEAVSCFHAMRAQQPVGVEHVVSLREDVYSLHCGQSRGATWYDEDQRVVWLLAYGLHRSGSRNDAYTKFVRLARNDALFPTEDDYFRIFTWRDEQIGASLTKEASALVAVAKNEPGREIRALVGDAISVSLVIDTVEESGKSASCLHVAISMAFRQAMPFDLPKEWILLVLAGFFPDSNLQALMGESHRHFPTRELDANEISFMDCWGDL
ncbi:MAG: hypothetical protein M3134_08970 [Actinomycetota bacterium]|nr:hypothetical protein [Actinomycetota bacterium]